MSRTILLVSYWCILLVTILLMLCASTLQGTEMNGYIGEDRDRDAVTVRDGYFVKGNKPFHFIGFNQYYMMEKARELQTRSMADDVLRDARKLGMTVMRTWAFDDRPNGLQTEPGQFDEDTFRGLDYVLAESAKHGIHVILSIVNYWADYGGMESYVKWCTDSDTIANRSISEFYTNPLCRQMYKNTMQTLMNRKNTKNGRIYKNDPTILGWDLANEPRNPGDPSGNVLATWIQEMSRFAKFIAPNQLITTGMEGFFGLSDPNLAIHENPGSVDWQHWVCQGTDFLRQHDYPAIDFTVAHLYPGHWVNQACNGSEYCKKLFASRWVDTHIEQSKRLRKPFVLEEFGTSTRLGNYESSMDHREEIFETVYAEMEQAAAARELGTGSLFWTFSSAQYPDYDGFTVYHGSEGAPPSPVLPKKDPDAIIDYNTTYRLEKAFRNNRRVKQCIKFLESGVKKGIITTNYRKPPIKPILEDTTSHDDTNKIVAQAASIFKQLSTWSYDDG